MKTYILRAVKYFVSLLILLVVIFAFMHLSGAGANGNVFESILSSRGVVMLVALLFLSAMYPYFGYVTREIKCDFIQAKMVEAFNKCGYILVASNDDKSYVFRADSMIKRIKTLGEDKIILTVTEHGIQLQGLRKEIVRLEYRLITFLKKQ